MSEWREVILGDLCARVTVGHVGKMADEYVEEGVPFLRSQNIKAFGISTDGMLRIGERFHKKLIKSTLCAGDVVVVRTGYPGTAAVVPPDLDGSNCADLVVITPSDELNPYMLAAIFNSSWGRSAVGGQLVGSAQQHFNVGSAKGLRVRLPDREEQDRIAAVLSTLGDLIENNRQRAGLLEQMAQAIYKEWFVCFRYPGHENDTCVDSLLGPIPESWRVKHLGELATNFDRFRKPLSKAQRTQSAGTYPYYGAAKLIDWVDGWLFDGEYLLFAEDGSVQTPKGFPVLQLVNGRFWANNHTHILQGRGYVSTRFLFLAAACQPIVGYVTGAAQPKITQANLNRIPFIVGPPSVHRAFESAIDPIFEEWKRLEDATAPIVAARDLLLPKLVTGQVDVSRLDLDELVGAAG
jgi:type I restriction enzyme S subunit